jgi:hypothetical protein
MKNSFVQLVLNAYISIALKLVQAIVVQWSKVSVAVNCSQISKQLTMRFVVMI